MTERGWSYLPPARDRVLSALRESGTRKQVAERAQIADTYASTILLALLNDGLVTRWKRPGTRAFLWKAVQ